MHNNKKKYYTYHSDLFQNCGIEIPDLDGINNFIKKINTEDTVVYFEVRSSMDYGSNYQLIESNKVTRIFMIKKMSINEFLFDCMFGSIYIMKKHCNKESFLEREHNKIKFMTNMIAIIHIDDIYECDVEVKEEYKDILLELIEYYGDSKKKIKKNTYIYKET